MADISSHPFSLKDKTVVVTGGASGIGAGIASVLAVAGANVVIVDINGDAAQRCCDELVAAGHNAGVCQMNLADETSIVEGFARIVDEFGVPWGLVNNAGLQDREEFLQGSVAEWDRMNAVNARGPFLLTREFSNVLVAAGQGGRVVNVASNSLRGGIVHGLVSYVSSKGAMAGLSHATAFELAKYGITVNTVLPGGVATPGSMGAKGPSPEGPARRAAPLGMCEPEDIASAVLFFVSPAAGKVTDQVVAVDGGFSVV